MSGLADGLNELQANMRGFVEAFMSLQPDGTGELRNPATPNETNDSRTVNKVDQNSHLSLSISFSGNAGHHIQRGGTYRRSIASSMTFFRSYKSFARDNDPTYSSPVEPSPESSSA